MSIKNETYAFGQEQMSNWRKLSIVVLYFFELLEYNNIKQIWLTKG
jgi:hypothetical protein